MHICICICMYIYIYIYTYIYIYIYAYVSPRRPTPLLVHPRAVASRRHASEWAFERACINLIGDPFATTLERLFS